MHSLEEIQDLAFGRIAAEAESYSESQYATAVFVQEALFAYTSRQKQENEDLGRRDTLMRKYPGDVILFPHELDDLRYRAAYHGAGMAAESDAVSPPVVHHRLSDNLENYMPEMKYERIVFPWTYRFKPKDLAAVLRHDFSIAASDAALGDLHRLAMIPEDGPDEETVVALSDFVPDDDIDEYEFDDEDDSCEQPGDYLEEAFLDFKPGVDAKEIVYSAFLRAGLTPPFNEQWSLDLERVVQVMIDEDDRLPTNSVDTV